MKRYIDKFVSLNWRSLLQSLRKQKYSIAVAVFIIWVGFIDSNNVFDRARAIQELNELKETKQFYRGKVEENTKLLNELKKNNDVLERYARERYWMKKKNEDIFLIVEE